MNLNDAPQKIRWATLAVLIGTAVVLSILDSSGKINNAFDFLRNPMAALSGILTAPAEVIAHALEGPRDLEDARAEIEELQAQIDALERENEQLHEVQSQYQVLLDLFNRARETPELRRITATVIGYDPNLAVQSLIIDQGRAEGVKVGMPVESARGLVGQIYRTSEHSSQVVLLTDSASSIPSRLGTSRATGLLQGGGLGGSLIIDWIDLKYQIAPGEVVLTSGLGGKFPQDVVIGRIVDVQRNEAELFQRAIVQPSVDFSALEMVFVITDFQAVNTDIFTNP